MYGDDEQVRVSKYYIFLSCVLNRSRLVYTLV